MSPIPFRITKRIFQYETPTGQARWIAVCCVGHADEAAHKRKWTPCGGEIVHAQIHDGIATCSSRLRLGDLMTKTKAAWIRDAGYPIGKPAPGRLNCACGNAPTSRFHASQGNVKCNCGVSYTWDGYILPAFADGSEVPSGGFIKEAIASKGDA